MANLHQREFLAMQSRGGSGGKFHIGEQNGSNGLVAACNRNLLLIENGTPEHLVLPSIRCGRVACSSRMDSAPQ